VAGRQSTGRFVRGTRELRELLSQQAVTVHFQPIIQLDSGALAGFEALGRGCHAELPESPARLLAIAESIGLAVQLSTLFRKKAVELVCERSDVKLLFLNTHPQELDRPGLLESLDELRARAPHLTLALEIHESLLTSPKVIAELRDMLAKRSILLAYDDFGAGQARLLELAEIPPDYLKFDSRFIAGLDTAPVSKSRLLSSLAAVSRAQLVKTVAEGIETAEEAAACRSIGFTHGQGYFLGRPAPIEKFPPK
jgi:EAL domain-containing protein (putative c-di-GMP-specific phosphodiesterase class I)